VTALVELRVDQPFTRTYDGHGIVVDVRQIATMDGAYPEIPFERSVVVAGKVGPTVIAVPIGKYRLEARLPEGRILRETRVFYEGLSDVVEFNTGGSPHEWLAWQVLSGNIPQPEVHEKWLNRYSRSVTQMGITLPNGQMVHGSRRPAINFAITPGGVGRWSSFEPVAALVDPEVDHHSDDILSLWRARFSYFPVEHRKILATRTVAFVETIGALLLAYLPVPWSMEHQGDAEIEIFHDPSIPSARELRVSVVDAESSALLSYLGASRMVEAAAAFKDDNFGYRVLQDIKDKRRNPLKAAAAAYVGLSLPVGDERRDRWSPWLQNLMRWFPAVPDGAILHARDLMERARTEQQMARALEAFTQAYRRGPPVFSVGVRHLLDGLAFFASRASENQDFDGDILKMYHSVSTFSLLVDPDQAFTVLRLNPRW